MGGQIEVLIDVDARKSERDVERLTVALLQVVTCRGARNGIIIAATSTKETHLREKICHKSLVCIDERVCVRRGQLERHTLRLSVPTVAQPSITDCMPLALGYEIEASQTSRMQIKTFEYSDQGYSRLFDQQQSQRSPSAFHRQHATAHHRVAEQHRAIEQHRAAATTTFAARL